LFVLRDAAERKRLTAAVCRAEYLGKPIKGPPSAGSTAHSATANRHEALGIKPFVKRWTPAADKLLGRMPDAKLAARLGRSLAAVMHRRVAMGRPPSHK